MKGKQSTRKRKERPNPSTRLQKKQNQAKTETRISETKSITEGCMVIQTLCATRKMLKTSIHFRRIAMRARDTGCHVVPLFCFFFLFFVFFFCFHTEQNKPKRTRFYPPYKYMYVNVATKDEISFHQKC